MNNIARAHASLLEHLQSATTARDATERFSDIFAECISLLNLTSPEGTLPAQNVDMFHVGYLRLLVAAGIYEERSTKSTPASYRLTEEGRALKKAMYARE